MSSDAADGPAWDSRAAAEGGPAPGDLYVLLETSELPIEWAVLDVHPSGSDLWRAVPADTNPLAGSDDVEVPADAPSGPLSLRCRFPVWLESAALTPERRTGRLADDHVQEALSKRRQIESAGVSSSSALAREVDADPEYRDWIGEVVSRAAALVPSPVLRWPAKEEPRRTWRPIHALAAALFGIAIGLSIWSAMLRREVSRLSAPLFDVPLEEVVLGSGSRGTVEVDLPAGKQHLMLVFVVDRAVPAGPGRLEIVDAEGKEVWESPPLSLAPYKELSLVLRRPLLAPGEYLIRLYGEVGEEPVAEQRLLIRDGEE